MSNDTQVQALMKLVVRWASTGREADQIALESALRDAPQQAEGWVMVPVDVLKAASESLGSFVSDHGWGDADMQAMDNLDAYLAARPSAPTVAEPDELMKFARRWEMLAYMHTRGVPFSVYDHYIGNPERLDYAATLHREYLASELDRASKGTP